MLGGRTSGNRPEIKPTIRMTIIEEIINEMGWQEPKLVTLRKGPKMVKNSLPTERFWELWRSEQQLLKESGFSVGKFGGDWSVSWWEKEGKWIMPVVETEAEVYENLPPLKPLANPDGLLKYQPPLVQVIVRAMDMFGASLNGCGTGVGKTFITLGAAREMGIPLLVVCPKNIIGDWKDAAKKMGVKLAGVVGWEKLKYGGTDFLKWDKKRIKCRIKGEVALVDKKDKMVWEIPPGTAVVFDEAHRAANAETQNSKLVQLAVDTGVPIFLLSATIADNPVKMKATGYALKLHECGKNFIGWMVDHGCIKTRFGWEFDGTAAHLRKVHRSIFPVRGVRVTAEQLGDAFPKTQIVAKAYNMEESGAIDAVYEEMMAKCALLETQEMNASERQANILVEILRARQRVELLKVPLMVNLARDYHEEGNSVFLAVNFRDTIKELIKQLGIECVIMGGQSPKDRTNAIERFQANDHRLIAGILKACREGLNLHDIHGGHPRVSLIMPTPSVFDLRQVLGRVHRANGKTPSIQRIIFARDTVEEDVCHSLASKIDHLDLLMDGDLQKGIFPPTYSNMRTNEDKEHEPEELLVN